jgi:glucose-6-phosphate 1-dehydrogenase
MVDKQDQLRRAESGAQADSAAAPSCAMVIFGAAGDLTKRLVVPALYDLVCAKRLPERFQLVGVDLAAKTAAEWSGGMSETMDEFVARSGGEFHVVQLDRTAWGWLTDRMTYLQGDLNDPETYRRLGDHLAELDKKAGTAGNYLFYLAVADRFFRVAVSGLGAAGLVDEQPGQWRRVVIEKPFGHDLGSASALNAEILERDSNPRSAVRKNAFRSCPFDRSGN